MSEQTSGAVHPVGDGHGRPDQWVEEATDAIVDAPENGHIPADADPDAGYGHGQDEPDDAADDAAIEDGSGTDGADADVSGDGPTVIVDEVAEAVLLLESWQTEIAATGDADVDAALTPLTEIAQLPVAEHADVYENVHGALADVLADLDRG